MTSPWEHFEAALSKKSISFEAIKDNITDDAELKQFIEALGITDFALVVSIKAEFKKRQSIALFFHFLNVFSRNWTNLSTPSKKAKD
jgi:hypothetical protein